MEYLLILFVISPAETNLVELWENHLIKCDGQKFSQFCFINNKVYINFPLWTLKKENNSRFKQIHLLNGCILGQTVKLISIGYSIICIIEKKVYVCVFDFIFYFFLLIYLLTQGKCSSKEWSWCKMQQINLISNLWKMESNWYDPISSLKI